MHSIRGSLGFAKRGLQVHNVSMIKSLFGTRHIYMDYAGSMPVLRAALRGFLRSSRLKGNPGALHTDGEAAANEILKARTEIAEQLGCKAHELIFTSGGTEGNNIAILGLFEQQILSGKDPKDTHWVVSSIEHPSVLECFNYIEKRGGVVSRIIPDSNGQINTDSVSKLLSPQTVCVSVGLANGEIGTVQPLSRISGIIREYEKEHKTRIIFHSDAGQSPLYYSPQVHTYGVDLFTLDGGKLGSVRGVGVLYVGHGVNLIGIMHGGSQEQGLRPGTENVASAASFAEAFKQVCKSRTREAPRLLKLKEKCIELMQKDSALENIIINGTGKRQLPHIINFSIPEIDNEYITLALDKDGISIATKSACKEGEQESHVVQALISDADKWRSRTALRVSFGKDTNKWEVERFVKLLVREVSSYKAHSKKNN